MARAPCSAIAPPPLWGIRPYSGKPEVLAAHAHRRGRLLVARRSPVTASEYTEHRGIPCTTPERTLIDFATVAQPHEIDRAVRESEFLGIVDFAKVGDMLDQRRRGTKDLRIAIERAADSMTHTRSDLEDRVRALVLDENLPTPEWNATIELDEMTIEVDVLWRAERIVVELDGWAAHRGRTRFAQDRARDRALTLAGHAVLRFTSADMDAGPIRQLLSERTPPRSGRPRSAALPA